MDCRGKSGNDRSPQRGGAHSEWRRRQRCDRRAGEFLADDAHLRIFGERHRHRGVRLDEVRAHLRHILIAEDRGDH